VLVLEELGTIQQDPMLVHGLHWLERHQGSDGSWRAESLNEKHDPQSDVGRFMTDAATGYAVMALEVSLQQQRDAAPVASAVGATRYGQRSPRTKLMDTTKGTIKVTSND
jgi:Squalene-hopene cyclase C-terminal domain